MKIVILSGGLGTRLGHLTSKIGKVEINAYQFKEFISQDTDSRLSKWWAGLVSLSSAVIISIYLSNGNGTLYFELTFPIFDDVRLSIVKTYQ